MPCLAFFTVPCGFRSGGNISIACWPVRRLRLVKPQQLFRTNTTSFSNGDAISPFVHQGKGSTESIWISSLDERSSLPATREISSSFSLLSGISLSLILSGSGGENFALGDQRRDSIPRRESDLFRANATVCLRKIFARILVDSSIDHQHLDLHVRPRRISSSK